MTRVKISARQRSHIDSMRVWCRRNLSDHRCWHMMFQANAVIFLFENERDAVQFCLAWVSS
jgi:hypothetical protein